MTAIRCVILAALLLLPDVPLGESWGLRVHWSSGLTLTNLAVPALAIPLLAGAWLAGRPLLARRPPGFALWMWALLAWGGLTLLAPLGAGLISIRDGVTLLAHLVKLAGFVWLGLALAGPARRLGRAEGSVLVAGVAVNAAVGLGQAAGRLPVFSPLAQSAGQARATGMFYDANMFGIFMAGALVWALASAGGARGRRAAGYFGLALLSGAALAATGSRAGWLALGAGLGILLVRGPNRAAAPWRCVAPALVVCLAGLALFPARSWQRLRGAWTAVVETAEGGAVAAPVADATTAERLGTMAQAWRQYGANPVLGLGFGRALYLGVPEISTDGPVTPSQAPVYQGAQNAYLTVLAGAGPLGLALLLLAVADPLWRNWNSAAAWPLLGGYVGLLVASLTLEALLNARLLALTTLLVACL